MVWIIISSSLPMVPFPSSGNYLKSVRESSHSLRKKAGISITPEAIQRLLLSPVFTTTFKRVSQYHGLALPLNFSSPLDELNILSILSLLNFASGYRVQLHHEVGRGAWDTIRAFVFSLYLSSSINAGDLLSAKGFATIDVTKVAELMGVNVHVERTHDTIPGLTIGQLGGPMYELVNLITGVLNETGKILVDTGYPSLGVFVAEALKEGAKAKVTPDGSQELEAVLERLVRAIPGFRDMTEVDGQPIYCFKKALFLIHAIVMRFGSISPPPFPLPKTTQTPIFTDNVLPSILIHLGVVDLSASPELASLFPEVNSTEKLKSLLETYNGPESPAKVVPQEGPVVTASQAFVLRAAAIDACELMVEAAHSLETLPDDGSLDWLKELTLPELDMWIWAVAKDRPDYRQLKSFVAIKLVYGKSHLKVSERLHRQLDPTLMMAHLSPDTETFSTPPTTPGLTMDIVEPSLSRRSSKPSSIHISPTGWSSDVVLENSSPNVIGKPNGQLSTPTDVQDLATTPRFTMLPTPPNLPLQPRPIPQYAKPTDSPCFVHSQLDKGASLTEWLRNKQHGIVTRNGDVDVARLLQTPGGLLSPTPSSESEEEAFGESLTKQLAETAVSVREMSKQLGRTRVHSDIQTVLIVTKARDNRLIKLTRELALYLMLRPRKDQKRGYVDSQLRYSRRFDAEGIRLQHPDLFIPFPRRQTSNSTSVSSLTSGSTKDDVYGRDDGQLRYWTSSMCSQTPQLFDFVVTLGGDGTVLFTSWLFQRIVPPVLPFALGSLGFLTNFDFVDHQAVMDSVLDSGIRVNLRMRFTCTVYRAVSYEEGKRRKAVKKGETGEIMMRNVEKGGWEALEGGWSGSHTSGDGKCNAKDKEIMCFTTRATETFEVLNDLVVDRGPSPYVSLLELFGDEHHMTTVQADGLTVSTPTGSTAYSLSAGGSLVHPEIPAILITPICPHTLSFRPMLLPDSMELRICVPYNSRSTAWASFDGRGRIELKHKQSTDWFHAISRTLKWNERERQKSFVVVEEENPAKSKKQNRQVTPESVDESGEDIEEEDEVSDEEDAFDINDSSSPEAVHPSPPVKSVSDREENIRRQKSTDASLKDALLDAIAEKNRRHRSRSRSRSSIRSGVDSPSRFAGPQPHPPRHVDFDLSSLDSNAEDNNMEHHHSQDGIHSTQSHSGRSRKGRDLELDNAKTPTLSSVPQERVRLVSRSRSADHPGRRAFAVWGHDESDSNASDSSGGDEE
ncbi:hypothetical protein C0995_016008 [Termitomyces sp. Mi166|nr:hypothetical protein C0995_016008 [Termitomyces sp. Mi166\